MTLGVPYSSKRKRSVRPSKGLVAVEYHGGRALTDVPRVVFQIYIIVGYLVFLVLSRVAFLIVFPFILRLISWIEFLTYIVFQI